MGNGGQVVIERQSGQARVGPVVVAVTAAEVAGAIRVGSPEGPVLRPLAFGERTRVVLRAAASDDPRAGVGGAVCRAATVTPGVPGAVESLVLDILALELAGAGLADAPSFTATLAAVARATGWSSDQLTVAPAAEVDRLAISLADTAPEDGWRRLVLVADPTNELRQLRADLADNLLRRARPTTTRAGNHARDTSPPDPAGSAASSSQPPAGGTGNACLLPAAPAEDPAQPGTTPPLLVASVDLGRVHRRTIRLPVERAGPAPRDSIAAAVRGNGSASRLSSTTIVAPAAPPRSLTSVATAGAPSAPAPDLSAWSEAQRLGPDSASEQLALVRHLSPGSGWAAGGRDEHWGDVGVFPSASPTTIEAPRAARLPAPRSPDLDEIADLLAALLHDEADLRGIDR